MDAGRARTARHPHRQEARARDPLEGRSARLRSLLPEPIRRFTKPSEIHDAEHLSFLQGGGHGGSHPHLVNEMLNALAQDRDPWPNATLSANWTCVGILAHESALKGGQIVHLPEFTLK